MEKLSRSNPNKMKTMTVSSNAIETSQTGVGGSGGYGGPSIHPRIVDENPECSPAEFEDDENEISKESISQDLSQDRLAADETVRKFVYPKLVADIPEHCVLIYPIHSNIFVEVYVLERDSKLFVGRLKCDSYVQLLTLPGIPQQDCYLELSIYLVSDSGILLESDKSLTLLSNWSDSFYSLGTCKIHKLGGDFEDKFIDVGVEVVDLGFIFRNKPVSLASFEGTFTCAQGKQEIKIKRTTNHLGSILFPVPPGELTGQVVALGTGSESHCLPIHHTFENPHHLQLENQTVSVRIDIPSDAHIRMEAYTIVESNIIGTISRYHEKWRSIVILGDVSGSMTRGMDRLQRLDYLKVTIGKEMFHSYTYFIISSFIFSM